MPVEVRSFAEALLASHGKSVLIYVHVLQQDVDVIDPILRVTHMGRDRFLEVDYGPIWKDGKIVQI